MLEPETPATAGSRRRSIVFPVWTWTLILGVGFFCLTASSARGQACFRGKPLPECRLFGVTEIGLGFKLGERGGLDKGWLVSDLGLLYNLDERHAVGVTTYVSFDTQFTEFRAGLKLRARRWLGRGFNVDAGGGLVFLGGLYDERQPGFASHVGLNYKDHVGTYLGCDVIRGNVGARGGTKWHMGVRFGSYAGSSLSAIALAAVAGVVFAIMTAG